MSTKLRTSIPSQRGLAPLQRVALMQECINAALSVGYLEETLALLKAQNSNVRISDDLESVWWLGYRLGYVRSRGRYCLYEQTGENRAASRRAIR